MYSYFKGVNLSIIFQKNNFLYLKILIMNQKYKLILTVKLKLSIKCEYIRLFAFFKQYYNFFYKTIELNL